MVESVSSTHASPPAADPAPAVDAVREAAVDLLADGLADGMADGMAGEVADRVAGPLESETGRALAGRAVEGAEHLNQALQDLPLTAHGVAALALLGGVVLWLAGGKVVKPMFAVIGGAAGGLAGSVVLPALGWTELFGFPAPAVGLAVGGIAGVMLAASAFRVVMGVTGAIALSLVGLMIGMAHIVPANALEPTLEQPAALMEADRLEREPLAGLSGNDTVALAVVQPDEPGWDGAIEPLDEDAEAANDQLRVAVEASRAFLDATGTTMREQWDQYEADQRARILGYAGLGLLVGFLGGVNLPRRSAAVVTALAGAGVTLFSAGWLTIAFDLPGQALLEMEPRRMLAVWAVLGAAGFAVQIMGFRRRSRSSDDEDG